MKHHQVVLKKRSRLSKRVLLLLFLFGSTISSAKHYYAEALSSIPPPPSVSMPVWSLAAPCRSSSDTSMNIVTFAMPVSVAPPKLWAVSLYTNTMTRKALLDSSVGVLQLLKPSQKDLVPMLGKRSGYEEGYSKRDECEKLGFGWTVASDFTSDRSSSREDVTDSERSSVPKFDLLPDCATYVKLKLLSVQEAGDHDVALCQVIGTGYWDVENGVVAHQDAQDSPICPALDHKTALYTGQLRQEGII